MLIVVAPPSASSWAKGSTQAAPRVLVEQGHSPGPWDVCCLVTALAQHASFAALLSTCLDTQLAVLVESRPRNTHVTDYVTNAP